MFDLRADCKNPDCDKLILIDGQSYDSSALAEIALLNMQRNEIMNQLVNSQWKPSGFQRDVKAFDHPIPKDIQATSLPGHCGDGESGDATLISETARSEFVLCPRNLRRKNDSLPSGQ